MRLSFALLIAFVPGLASAQPDAAKKETVKWITDLQDPNGGFYLAPQDPKSDAAPRPSLRATNGAVRALKYLGAEVPNKKKHMEFVIKCYSGETGAFAEPGGKPDVAINSIGIMAATELGIPKDRFPKAMDYLKENAKTFEDVRIGAAAVEAWGVKDCPFPLAGWAQVGATFAIENITGQKPDEARDIGSMTAMVLRLETPLAEQEINAVRPLLADTQLPDGGWGKKGDKASDIESTYRVMRALMLLKTPPKDVKKLREFVAAHRNKDGGYATKPGEKSTMSGVYYCVIVSKWLDEMEKK